MSNTSTSIHLLEEDTVSVRRHRAEHIIACDWLSFTFYRGDGEDTDLTVFGTPAQIDGLINKLSKVELREVPK